jgi:uncharacterized protein (DUF58 family)
MKRTLYLLLHVFSSTRYWVRRHFTRPGLLALGGLAASAALGVDTNQTMAYQLFTFLLALLAIALVTGLFFRPKFSVKRIVPRYAVAGQPFDYHVMLKNLSDKAQTGLILLDKLADPRPTFAEFGAVRGTPGYDRWQRWVSKNSHATPDARDLPPLPPASETRLKLAMTPVCRGHVRFDGVTVARPDPFGLFRACVDLAETSSVLALPKRYVLPRLSLPGTRQYQHGGVTLASSVGDSEEFIGLRDYRSGDPLQRIHWKSFAKAGKPVIKEFQDEFFERHALVLDTFAYGGAKEIFEEAVSVAASFVYAIDTQECLLDLMFVDAQAYCFSAGRGQLQIDKMLEILAEVQPAKEKSLDALHHAVAGRRAALSSCICVLLQWDEARRSLVRDLQMLGLPLIVLVIGGAPQPPEPWLHVLELGKIQQGLMKL